MCVAVQASSWATPGQYTGKAKLAALTSEDHKTGFQAWVKKVSRLIYLSQHTHSHIHTHTNSVSLPGHVQGVGPCPEWVWNQDDEEDGMD